MHKLLQKSSLKTLSLFLVSLVLFSTTFSFYLKQPHKVIATGTDNVLTMGKNSEGQLGYGTTDFNTHATPTTISSFANVIDVTAGTEATFSVKKDGSLWSMGNNYAGQLGDNTTTRRTSPVQVVSASGSGSLENVKKVDSQAYHTVALKWDNTVWSWGTNNSGQLGDGTTTERNAPVQVVGSGGSGTLTDVVQIVVGDSHTIALKSNGTVWSWGANSDGQLGDNTTSTRTSPVQVVGSGGSGYLTDIVEIAAGEYFTLALKADGTVWSWGKNGNSQLGDGTTTQRNAPVQVVGAGGSGTLSSITQIAAGRMHVLALKADGTVWSWGYNDSYGALGINASGGSYNNPQQVKDSSGSSYLTHVTKISAGGERSFAITRDRKVWGWGENNWGFLGNGGTSTELKPKESTGLYGAADVSTGYNNTAAYLWD